MQQKKAQGWSLDFIAGLLFFLFAIVLSVKLITNALEPNTFEEVYSDAQVLSDSFMGEGFPPDWDASDVVTIGLTTESRLNATKIARLYTIPYADTKALLNSPYEYYLYFSNDTANLELEGQCGYGMPGSVVWSAGCTSPQMTLNATNLVSIQRLTVYNNSLVAVTFWMWER